MDSPTTREGAEDLLAEHPKGVTFRHDGTKTWVPLEQNPESFAHLSNLLGVSPDLGFYDVYSLDEPDLLAMIPRPVHAIIFIAAADTYHKVRAHDGSKELAYDGSGPEEPVFWARQTIGHACGTMALLHSVNNGTTKQFIPPGSDVALLMQDCLHKKPKERAAALYNSGPLEKAHMEAAFKGQSTAPQSQEPNGYHFLAFVKGETDGHLYEMDGGWNGPIDRGPLGVDEDLLSEQALDLGPRRFIKLADGVLEFAIIALAQKPA